MPLVVTSLPITTPSWVPTISTVQESYKQTNGKYRQYLLDSITDGSEIHEYVSPLGPGYVTIERVLKDGKEYTRIFNFGPQTSREHGWQETIIGV